MRLLVVPFLVALAVPVYAVDDPYPELSDPSVLALFAKLFVDGGAGFRETERAAFLLLDPDGTYSLAPWPATHAPRAHTFTGTVPHFTLAIVHTHPADSPRPSAADRDAARKLARPVIVLTPRDIAYVTPGGAVVEVVASRRWAQ